MASLKNSVHLIGHLGKDPEVRTFDSGKKQASFSIATSETFKNLKGEKVEETQWHNLIVWGKLAEIAGQYLKKGSEVAIEGTLVHRTYETKGTKKYVTEIVVNELLMLRRK